MKLSVVTTLYHSAPYIEEFHQRVSAAARQLVGEDFEIIMVNDGSPDRSLEVAVALTKSDPHLVVVDLSRNFGHHKAMMAGLGQAQGEKVFLIDVDLEEDPEWLLPFAAQMEREGCDVVYGVQQSRKGGWFERWSGALYYKIFNWLCDIDHPENIVTARIMTKKYVESLLMHHERSLVFSCICLITGFKQQQQIIVKHSTSRSTYTLRKKMAILTEAITSFSDAPLRLFFYLGLMILGVSVGVAAWLVARKVFLGVALEGWVSVMVSIWLLGGIMICLLGVIGLYLAKVFIEVKQRPLAIVRQIYGTMSTKGSA